MKKMATSGYFLVILATLGFSFKAVLVKIAYGHGVDAMTLMLMRIFISMPFFLATLHVMEGKRALQAAPADLAIFAFMGIVGIGCAMFFSFYSLELIDASLSTLVVFTYPAITLLMLIIFLKEKATAPKLFSALMTFLGLVLVVRLDKVDLLAVNGKGILFGLIAAFSFASYNVLSERVLKNISPVKVITYCMIFLVGFFGTFFWDRTYPKAPEVWFIASILGIFCGYMPFLFYNYGVKRIGAGKSVIVSSLGPVFTVLLAFIFLNERLAMVQIAGMGMIVLGVMALKLQYPPKIASGTSEEIKKSVEGLFAKKGTNIKAHAVIYMPGPKKKKRD